MDWLKIKEIPGWMDDTDLYILSTLSSCVQDNGHILEIGSFLGRSTSSLYLSKKNTVSLSIVDEFKIAGMYNSNLNPPRLGNTTMFKIAKELAITSGSWRAGFEYCLGKEIYNQINVNEILSDDFVIDKTYDLAFIDGGHGPGQVKRDIMKVISDTTLIVGDDFSSQHIGVVQGLLPFIKDSEEGTGRSLFVPKNSKLWILIPNKGYWHKLYLFQKLLNIGDRPQ
jgi:hypothetical protein